jgi:hypothetical protein
MGRERYWRCKKIHSDVELRSNDDRTCQSCHDKNVAEMELIRHRAADVESVITTTTIAGQDRMVKHASSSKNTATTRLRQTAVNTAKQSPIKSSKTKSSPLWLELGGQNDKEDKHSTAQAAGHRIRGTSA